MQSVLVILAIILALTYLGYQFYTRFFKKDKGCDGCAVGKTSTRDHK